MDIHVSARGTRALPGTGRRSCRSQKRLAGTAEPVRVARPEAVGLKVLRPYWMPLMSTYISYFNN